MGNNPGKSPEGVDTGVSNSGSNSKSAEKFPYKQRKQLIREIENNVRNKNIDTVISYLRKLRVAIGLDETGKPTANTFADIYLTLDEYGVEHVLQLTRLVNLQPHDWVTQAELLCHQLLVHYGPPINVVPEDIPKEDSCGLLRLNLMGKDLNTKNRIKTVKQVIAHNKDLTSIELAFSGLDNSALEYLLPALVRLEKLTYVGLRGNMLDKCVVEHFVKLLRDKANFPSLMWIDLYNNKDIFTVPQRMLSALHDRWPQAGYKPSFSDLAQGKAVITDDLMELNV